MTRRNTFALLGGLYVSQYLGVGFFYTALAAILRDRGMPLEQLGLLQLLGMIWAVKFAWAPLLDRHGSYRGWLLVLQPAIVVGLLLITPLDPVDDFGLLILVATAIVALSATQDIAADAIAVQALDSADRGTGNGIQVAGGYLGHILGGGAVLVVYDRFGWVSAIGTLAVLTALPVWQVRRYAEPPRRRAPAARGSLLTVFRTPGTARWALGLLPLLWTAVGAAYALVTPMLVDAGWSLTRVGLVTTVVGGGFAIAAATSSGLLVRRLGRRRALLAFSLAQVVAVLGLLPLTAGDAPVLVAGAAVCLMNAAYAATSTIVNTVNMDLCRDTAAGTDFTVLTCVMFLAGLVSGAIALGVAGQVGYRPVILAAAALVLLSVLVSARAFVDRSAELVGEPEPAG